MKLLVFVILAFMFLCIADVFAVRIIDNLYFTMNADSVECIDLVLPDDLGVSIIDKVNHTILCDSNWSQLTEQVVATDENNTAKIPICFLSFGKNIGECTNFTILVLTPAIGMNRSWKGGICVSPYRDVDILSTTSDVSDALNTHFDLFDVNFDHERKASKPGEKAGFTLLLQSYANLTFHVKVDFNDDTILEEDVNISSDSPYRELRVSVSSNKTGEHRLSALVSVTGCELESCRKSAEAWLVVSDETLAERSFKVSLFPKNIDMKDLRTVVYRATITNGDDRARNLRVDVSSDCESDIGIDENLILLHKGESKIVRFNVTPKIKTGLCMITLTVASSDEEKSDTSFISVNEMVTDTARSLDMLVRSGKDVSDVYKAKDVWYLSYKQTGVEGSLKEYESLQDAVKTLKETKTTENKTTTHVVEHVEEEKVSNRNDIFVYVLIILGIIGVIIFLYIYKRSSTPEEDRYYF